MGAAAAGLSTTSCVGLSTFLRPGESSALLGHLDLEATGRRSALLTTNNLVTSHQFHPNAARMLPATSKKGLPGAASVSRSAGRGTSRGQVSRWVKKNKVGGRGGGRVQADALVHHPVDSEEPANAETQTVSVNGATSIVGVLDEKNGTVVFKEEATKKKDDSKSVSKSKVTLLHVQF